MNTASGILDGMDEDVRQKIRMRMVEKGVTQAELAEQLGVTRQYVSGMLAGREALPKKWQSILRALDLTLVAVKEGERVITVPKNAKVSITYEAEGLEPAGENAEG